MNLSISSLKPVKLALCSVAVGAAISLTGAPSAAADPILPTAGNGSASDAVSQLQAAGYDVSINYLEGNPNVPLSECRTQSIRGLSGKTTSSDVMMMLMGGELYPVSIDVACPNAK
jgi:hypothetical protein